MSSPACPACGAEIPDDPRFSAWCEACDWNLDPMPPPTPQGPLASWRARRSDLAARRAHAQVMRRGADAGRGIRAAALAAAVPVHLVTVAAVAAAVRLAFSSAFLPLRILVVAALGGSALAVLPRPDAAPTGPGVLTPTDAPATWDVVSRVAQTLGCRPPDLIVVDDTHNAALGEVGWRRRTVLVLGVPLWNALEPAEKLALLGHELGHRVNGDVRRSLPVSAATVTLRRWTMLLLPDEVSGFGRRGVLHASLQRIVFAVVWLIGSGLESLADRAGQGAEYRADLASARVAGTDAAASLLRSLEVTRLHEHGLRTAVNGRAPDVWAAQRRYLAEVPPREVLRAERVARARLHRVDDSHPPTPFRIDFLSTVPRRPPAVDVPRPTLRAMDAEMLSVMRADLPEVALRRRPVSEEI